MSARFFGCSGVRLNTRLLTHLVGGDVIYSSSISTAIVYRMTASFLSMVAKEVSLAFSNVTWLHSFAGLESPRCLVNNGAGIA